MQMNMVISESLRLYPPALGHTRKVKNEVGKLLLPANLELFLPNLALHHDAQIWGGDAPLFKDRNGKSIVRISMNMYERNTMF